MVRFRPFGARVVQEFFAAFDRLEYSLDNQRPPIDQIVEAGEIVNMDYFSVQFSDKNAANVDLPEPP